MGDTDSTSEQNDEETKKCRAFLRERFLRFVANFTGKLSDVFTNDTLIWLLIIALIH